MIEWIRKIDGAMEGNIARAIITSWSFLQRSREEAVRLLIGSATGQESGIPDEFPAKYKYVAGKLGLWLCLLVGTLEYQEVD